MKNIFLKIRLVVLTNLIFLSVSAHDFEVGGIYYNVTSLENLEVEVTSYCDYQDDEYDEHKYSGDIVIPETVTYKNRILSVTSIESGAFRDCSGLTSVDIPDGVTQIGDYAFNGCSGLTSIDIPDGVTEIGRGTFYNCSGLTSIDIPDGVTEIGRGTFYNCSGLTSIDIPDRVTKIGDYAFRYCSGLTSIDIPDGVTKIGDYAFQYCSGLTSIDIPDGVTEIGDYAFGDCSGLTSIDIPDGVTKIGDYAFTDCDTIDEFIFPANTNIFPVKLFVYYYNSGKLNQGTIVKKLCISDSPEKLIIREFGDTDNSELYYCGLQELYIGREIHVYDVYSLDYIFSETLEKVEIGGYLKSDRFVQDNDDDINSFFFYGKTYNISTIIYGDNIAEITDPVTAASEIYLRNTTPPVTKEWENSNYVNSILYVPQGTLAVYQNADVWKNFWDIREWDATTDVKSPTIDNTDAVDVSIDGKQVTVTTNNPGTRVQIYNTEGVLIYDGNEGTVNLGTPGLYIIKAGNQTKKLLIK